VSWLKRLFGGGREKPIPVPEASPVAGAAPSAEARPPTDPKAAFFAAIRAGRFDEVRERVSDDDRLLEAREEDGTALHHAALHGKRDIVELFLDRGADPEAADSAGRTPIEWANEAGQQVVVHALFGRGASADVWHAAAYGLVERVRAALDEGEAGLDEPSGYGTPLHWACLWGRSEVVDLLLERGADLAARNRDGETAAEIVAALRSGDAPAGPKARQAEREGGWIRCAELLRVAAAERGGASD
jgi:hypothetical protein